MAQALNKVIEQVAYKQVEDMIVYLELLSEQIISTSKVAQQNKLSFSTPANGNADMNKKLAESQAIIKQLKTQVTDLENGYKKLSDATVKHTAAVSKLTLENRQKIIDDREIRKNLDLEAIGLSSLTTYIQKLSSERLKASRTVADYNAMVSMGTALTEEQTQELAQATAQFQKYDTAIKAGKASIGDAREYVGQYERANVGLANSVAQIARELPSATFGFQTFALAISNNVPIFVDQIQQAVLANKELVAQGKETTSVFKQVGNALLSFNTFMSVGLLLVSLYGKEISNWVKELFGASDALDELNKNQKAFNNAKLEGTKQAQADILEVRKYLAVYNDEKLTAEQREIAYKKLNSQFPYYIRSVKDATTVNGQYSTGVKQLLIDLEKQKEVEDKTKINVQNKQRLIDLQKQREELEKTIPLLEKTFSQLEARRGEPGTAGAYSAALGNLKDARKGLTNANSEYNKIMAEVIKNDSDIFQLKKETIGLEYTETKAVDENTKSIKLNTKAREDYLASEYELLHLRLTNVKNANKDILEDEASGYDLRLMASEQYYQNLLDLANMEAKEELRILQFATEDKLRVNENEFLNYQDSLKKQLSSSKITAEQKIKIEKELTDSKKQFEKDKTGIIQDATNKQNIIYENQAQKLIEANKATVGQLKRIWDEINFGKAEIEIGNVDLTNIQKLGEVLKGISTDMSIEETQRALQKVSEIAKDNQNDINKREAQLALDRAERAKVRLEEEIRINGIANNLSEKQIQEQLINNQALQDADKAIIESKKRVAEADNAITQTQIDNAQRLRAEQEKVNEAIYQGKLGLYESIKDLAGQLFENQVNDYDRQIEKSNEYYDALIGNAEKGSEQEKLLQEEKEKREADLQRRKIALQRKQAIFDKLLAVADIAIKLQQEIANIRKTFVEPAASILTGFAIAGAGVRTATVLATPLPQYEKGRLGGKAETALINEKVIEPVESTDGTITMYGGKNRIVNLKSGDIVHKSLDDFQNSKFALENASIMASFANQYNSLQKFDFYIAKQLNGMSEKMAKTVGKEIKAGFSRARINNTINIDNGSGRNRNFRN